MRLRYAAPTVLGQFFDTLIGPFGSAVLILFLVLAFLPGRISGRATFRGIFLPAALLLFGGRLCGRVWILGESAAVSNYLYRAMDLALGIACGSLLLGLPFILLGHSIGLRHGVRTAVGQFTGISFPPGMSASTPLVETLLRIWTCLAFLSFLWSPPLATALCFFVGSLSGIHSAAEETPDPRGAEFLSTLTAAIFIGIALIR